MERTLEASMPMAARNQDPDVELIERYFAGDTSAFDEIIIRYERQIYRVCYRFVEHREDAMDLAQDVFVKAFEHLPTFRRESTLKTWLYRIAINHCLNHVKKHLQVAGTPAFSQQRPQQRPVRRVLQDAVLGFYVSEFQQQAEVSGETFAKILPFLQQFVQDRFAVRVEVQPIPTPSRRLGATVVPSSGIAQSN